MPIEYEKENHNVKVNLLTAKMTIDDKVVKNITGKIISFFIKDWGDGGHSCTLGLQDDENNFWINFNSDSFFALGLFNKMINLPTFGKPVVTLSVFGNKDMMTDKLWAHCSLKLNNKEVSKKFEKLGKSDLSVLIDDLKIRFGKEGQPKPEDETEPVETKPVQEEWQEPGGNKKPATIPQLNDENTAIDNDVPF